MYNHLYVGVTGIILLLGLVVLFMGSRDRRGERSLPPGPPRDALIGNLRLFAAHASGLERPFRGDTFHEWARTYGDVMYLEVLGRRMVILDSVTAATDLLDKRSGKYSSRPVVAVLNMIGWKNVLGFLPYGNDLHIQRGMVQRFLGRDECRALEAMQTREVAKLINSLLDASLSDRDATDVYHACLKRYMVAIIMQAMYGYTPEDDSFVELVEDLAVALNNSDSFLADCFPRVAALFTWFPYSTYSRAIQYARHLTSRVLRTGFEFAQSNTSESVSSFVNTYLDRPDLKSLNGDKNIWNEHVKNAAGMCYWAASDTVYGTLLTCIFAIIRHPEIQRKAQDEIDQVVGRDRLPEFRDRQNLPFVECILRETLRWNPVAPIGVPHVSTEDDVYRDMFIPKDTIIIPNLRGIFMNEEVYLNPEQFEPARFLPRDRGGREEPFLPPFGFGRRICPGRHFADSSIWIALVRLIATCTISPAIDDNGYDIIPKREFTDNVAVTLKPFPFSVRPRSVV